MDEDFVIIIDLEDGEPRERILKCLERTTEAVGKMDDVMVSPWETSPVLCVVGKHLTPRGVYDKFIFVMPADALLIDSEEHAEGDFVKSTEYWKINNKIFKVESWERGGLEGVRIKRLA